MMSDTSRCLMMILELYSHATAIEPPWPLCVFLIVCLDAVKRNTSDVGQQESSVNSGPQKRDLRHAGHPRCAQEHRGPPPRAGACHSGSARRGFQKLYESWLAVQRLRFGVKGAGLEDELRAD